MLLHKNINDDNVLINSTEIERVASLNLLDIMLDENLP